LLDHIQAIFGSKDPNVIDTFFSRPLDLDLDKRAEIAERIAIRTSAKKHDALPTGVAEWVLESIAYTMRADAALERYSRRVHPCRLSRP
jgi:hypothetical protein